MLGALSVDDDTLHWLVNRQIDDNDDKGGFSGRVNKNGDTCYSFWVGGALDVYSYRNIDTDPQPNGIYLCGMESHLSPFEYSASPARWIWQS
jgi:prenyltransferase beta subunit